MLQSDGAMLHPIKISKQDRTLIDRTMLLASIIYPLMVLPQIYHIYTTKDASGVSLTTWVGFILFGTIFLLYGISHRLKPYIITQILWFTVDLLVIVGILLYS